MAGSLAHAPADIIRQLMVDLSLGTAPSAAGTWPVYVGQEPNTPDKCLTVYGTSSVHQGRVMDNGEVQERVGFQVRIRAANYVDAETKASAIAISFDQSIERTSVTVGANVYRVNSISRTSGPIDIGKNVPATKRDIFTYNATASIKQTT